MDEIKLSCIQKRYLGKEYFAHGEYRMKIFEIKCVDNCLMIFVEHNMALGNFAIKIESIRKELINFFNITQYVRIMSKAVII